MKEKIIKFLYLVLSFCVGWYCAYHMYVPNLQVENQRLQELAESHIDITNFEQDTIKYTAKDNGVDADVDIKESKDIIVKYNNQQYTIPNQVNEDTKFDKGKLVIEHKADTAIDFTNVIEKAATDKAKQYSRVGKADFGCIYDNKDNDMYAGIRYNAKAYDIGYYHNIDGSDWMIGFHYKF